MKQTSKPADEVSRSIKNSNNKIELCTVSAVFLQVLKIGKKKHEATTTKKTMIYRVKASRSLDLSTML